MFKLLSTIPATANYVRRSRFMTFALTTAATMMAFMPMTGWAHVRWFVDNENPGVSNFEPYSLLDPAVLTWIAIAVGLIVIAVVLDTRLPSFPVADTKVRHDVMELMRILAGMSFLLTAYDGALIAPHLIASGGLGSALVL